MPSFCRLLLPRLLGCGFIFFCATSAFGAATIPPSDATVLERLPFKPNDPIARELAGMRAELRRDPRQLTVAVALAQRYYAMVGEDGDPRYLGYAQAALAPWWQLPQPPLQVQLLRASLAQFRHDFAAALADLDAILKKDARHAQARVLRAVIQIVQAQYASAMADCRALNQLTSDVIAVGCEAMVDGLTGKAAGAYTRLSGALNQARNISAEEKLWALIRLAELSQRQGKNAIAENHFREALKLGIADSFLLAAYADFLLDQQRPLEVVALLKEKTRSDGLLLRLLFAERSLNLPTAKEHQITMAARYRAAQLRGDTVHQQEEARFALHVQGDAKRALMLAQENWTVQREPRDARILLEAALALPDGASSGINNGATKSVLQWLASSRIEDSRLIALGQQLQKRTTESKGENNKETIKESGK